MTEEFTRTAAAVLAGISAGAFVCAIFYTALAAAPIASRGKALATLLNRAARRPSPGATRDARRAQAIALKLVEQEQRSASGLRQKLAHAGLSWSPARYSAASFLLGAAVFALASLARQPAGFCLSAAIFAGVLIPPRILALLAHRRQKRFLSGFAGALDMIVRGARSGLSLPDCLAMVANDGAPAVRREFAPIVSQLRAGMPLAAAAERLASGMPVAELRFFALVVTIQSQTGGNFTEALANLAHVLRERDRLAAKVRTASAEVKASAITVGSLPFVVAGATAWLSPDYIAVLWQEEGGRKLSAMCILWLVCGVVTLRRMARIEA